MTDVMVLGCGEIGREVVRDLLENSNLKIIAADVREEVGKRFVRELGSNRVTFRRVDVRKHDELVEALKEVKAVINTVGPYFEFGTCVADAAIEAGVNYVDVCDDHDVTADLLELHSRVEKENLTFVINAGASPGLTNLMARIAAEKLDEVKSVRVYWYEGTAETIGYGQLAHWAHITMGKVPSYTDGRWVMVKGLTERELVEFPEPCGVVPVYHVGHPEPVTIPRYIETDEAICKGGVLPESNITLTKVVEKLLVIKTNRTIRWTCKFFLKLLPLLSGGGGDKESASAFRCDVMGKSGSEAKKICQAISGKVAKLTSVPASLFARMIVERQIETPGVYPPEGIPELDIQLLMRELNKREIRIREV